MILLSRNLDRGAGVAILAILLSVSGCGGNGDFVRLRNPLEGDFEGLRAAATERKAVRKYKKEKAARAAESGEESVALAGDDGEGIDTGTVRRGTAGEVCYDCNGKGYQMKFSGSGGDYYLCAKCGGTGRR